MYRIFSGAMWLLVLNACSAVPENHYFTMAYVLLPNPKQVEPFPATLRIRRLEVAPAYETERIVYRYSPYEFRYYNYMLWAVKPQNMITDLLVRHLRHANLFMDVGLQYQDRRPEYEMTGMVSSIEELDSGDEWYARLAFSLRMSRFRGDRVIWSYDADVKKRVYNKAPVYVVRALSELIEEELHKVVKSLGEFLQAEAKIQGKKP